MGLTRRGGGRAQPALACFLILPWVSVQVVGLCVHGRRKFLMLTAGRGTDPQAQGLKKKSWPKQSEAWSLRELGRRVTVLLHAHHWPGAPNLQR